jgi:hypothetical protein
MPIASPLQFICQEGQPLIKLDENGVAPVLDYALPQDNSFTTYGKMSMNLPNDPNIGEENFFTVLAHTPPIVRQAPIRDPANLTAPRVWQASDFVIDVNGDYDEVAWQTDKLFTSVQLEQLKSQVGFRRVRNTRLYKDIDPEFELITEERTWEDVLKAYLDGYNPTMIAQKVNEGFAIQVTDKNGGLGKKINFIPRPTNPPSGGNTTPELTAIPQLYIIEEYVTKSYARNYGAGKTLQIHSLFPGEKTTITIKTFKQITTLKSRAENIIDSFSQESAQELENLLENEANTSNTTSQQTNVNVQAGVNFPLWSASANVNHNTSSSRTANTRNLSKALSKSVDKSNSSREININTSTQETQTESEEVATVRQFENVNVGKVLNLAFRELLQQYVTITYLNDIKIGFSNGNTEMDRVFSIEELDELLRVYIKPEHHDQIKARLLYEYGNQHPQGGMQNEWGSAAETAPAPKTDNGRKSLIVEVPHTPFGGTATTYLAKNKVLESTYEHTSTIRYKVPGIILNVQDYTLRTPAIVVDAFLGHGDALDCEAREMQAQNVIAKQLENQKTKLILDTMSEVTNLSERLRLMTEFFNPAPKEIVKETVSNSNSVNNTTERTEINRG